MTTLELEEAIETAFLSHWEKELRGERSNDAHAKNQARIHFEAGYMTALLHLEQLVTAKKQQPVAHYTQDGWATACGMRV